MVWEEKYAVPSSASKELFTRIYGLIRDNEEEFNRAARSQYLQSLAAQGGRVQAFGRHFSDNEQIENLSPAVTPWRAMGVDH